jgi:hypothetical protein
MAKQPFPLELKEQGSRGEKVFQDWLDASRVPYAYFEQQQWSFPNNLEHKLKRPDFLVGIAGLGSFAFDVKTKTMSSTAGFSVNEEEIQQFYCFQRYFNTTVLYAFIPPSLEYEQCCLITNDQFLLYGEKRQGKSGEFRHTLPAEDDWVSLKNDSFLDALRRQIEL